MIHDMPLYFTNKYFGPIQILWQKYLLKGVFRGTNTDFIQISFSDFSTQKKFKKISGYIILVLRYLKISEKIFSKYFLWEFAC